jgi:hypothetical protein
MSKDQSTTTAQGQSAPPLLPWGAPAFPTQIFESAFKPYSYWLENAQRLQTESVNFFGGQMGRYIDALKNLGSCKSPENFLKLQSDFSNGLVQDYLEESKKFIDMYKNCMSSADSE